MKIPDLLRRGRATIVVGGQFGSEGKGLAAAWVAEHPGNVGVATSNAGAQAGHTTVNPDGSKFVCFHIPTIGVVRPDARIYVNAGAIIDPDVLLREVDELGIEADRVTVHPRAAIIDPMDRIAEHHPNASTTKLASTQKGVGSAQSRKILRSSGLAKSEPKLARFIGQLDLNRRLDAGDTVTVEVPQGADLSINHGLSYPHCTSRDAWVGSGLSDAGIHPTFLGQVVMVVRTYPIRVGNIVDPRTGAEMGNSGPFWPDSREMSWSEFPGVEPERTTVTKRVRRIATWSRTQYRHSLLLNRPSVVFVNFVNYFGNAETLIEFVRDMQEDEMSAGINPSKVFSVGPCHTDVLSLEEAYEWLKTNR